jgi:hypothetical protein
MYVCLVVMFIYLSKQAKDQHDKVWGSTFYTQPAREATKQKCENHVSFILYMFMLSALVDINNE